MFGFFPADPNITQWRDRVASIWVFRAGNLDTLFPRPVFRRVP